MALAVLGGDSARVLLVCPFGGAPVGVDRAKLKLGAFAAPVGQAIKGLAEGGDCSLKSPAGVRVLEVVHRA